MNKDELKAILEAEGIKSMFYSLNGVRYDECLVLENPNVGCWNVYYSERGSKTGLREFGSEDESCRHILFLLRRSVRNLPT